jgi:hypothetical protein
VMNAVDIAVGRSVGHAGAETMEVRCPVCATEYRNEAWHDAVNQWSQRVETARAVCDSCEVATPADLIVFLPAWGFGNLDVTFWNWPRLHDDFVAELRTILGRRAVYQWLRS